MTSKPSTGKKRSKRRVFLFSLFAIILLAAIIWALWYFLLGQWYESTDDAYVDGNIVQITPRISGTVISIDADNNDYVLSGQNLAKLDPADADVAFAQAKAKLGQTVRQISGLYNAVTTSAATVKMRKNILDQAQEDYDRRVVLAKKGAISGEEFAHIKNELKNAQSSLDSAQAQLLTDQAQIAGTSIESHPDVLAAAEDLRKAWLDDHRTNIPAPVNGYIAKRAVQIGQHVQPGTALMAVVPLDKVWVDANFKETQLKHMRIGQEVKLNADIYGDDITYSGTIAGLGIGTGSAFSLLPAQNATGNWIKIVQRLPVRIELDPKELEEHPLRIGLSMNVEVDLHDRSGDVLAPTPRPESLITTTVFDNDTQEIDDLIADIIADNSNLLKQ